MASNNGKNPSAFLKKVDLLESGTTKNVVGKSTVTVAGNAMTGPQINTTLGKGDVLYSAVTSARAALKQALSAYEAALPDLEQFVKDYVHALKGTFGSKNPVLVDFGIAIAKTPVRSVETKAKALAKSRGTRDVRGIKGKVQRQAITTAGTPGLALVTPEGQLVTGALSGPIPPGASAPVDVAGGLPVTGAAPAGGSTPAAASPSPAPAAPAAGEQSPAGK